MTTANGNGSVEFPPAAFLDCHQCGHVWVQTVGYAMANPTAICRCPACGEPYRLPEHRADAPVLVLGKP